MYGQTDGRTDKPKTIELRTHWRGGGGGGGGGGLIMNNNEAIPVPYVVVFRPINVRNGNKTHGL